MADLIYKQYSFDPHGTNPDNDIKDEMYDLAKMKSPFIIPNGAPFKAGSLSIKTEAGQQINTGFTGQLKPVPLIDATGLDMFTFVELSDELIAKYKDQKLLVSYHTVGIKFIPANDFETQLHNIIHRNKPIPWSQIIQVPATLPAEYHWHSIEELVDWRDLVAYVKYLIGVYAKHSAVTFAQVEATTQSVMAALEAKRVEYTNLLNGHEYNYSAPHLPNKGDLGLSNVSNYPLATPAQDQAGIINNAWSTPKGIVPKIKSNRPDTSGIMKKGILPISMYKGSGFLPPNIDGSFEAIGRNGHSFFMVEENDGNFNMLANHYDGRVEGLYIDQVKPPLWTSDIRFLGIRYEHPSFANLAIQPLTATGTTQGEILMVGNFTSFSDWMITRTNGTLDSKAHRYARVDASEMVSKAGGNPTTLFRNIRLQYMGKWVYAFVSGGWGPAGATGSIMLFRLLTSDIIDGATVKFVHVKVNYTDMDGVEHLGADYINMLTPVNTDGKLTRFYWTFENSNMRIGDGFMRNMRIFSAAQPGTNETKYAVQFSALFRLRYVRPDGIATEPSAILELISSFDPETVTLTLVNRTPMRNTDGAPANWGADTQELATLHWGPQFEGTCLARDGTYMGGSHPDPQVFPFALYLMRYPGATTPYDTVLKLSSRTVNSPSAKQINTVLDAPTLNGMYQLGTVYDGSNEVFRSQQKGSTNYNWFYRKVTGSYAERQSNKLLSYPTALSRPLTSDIYSFDLTNNSSLLSVTGTAAELAAAQIEMGDLGLAVGLITHQRPDFVETQNNGLFNTKQDGVFMTLPRGYDIVTDNVTKKASILVNDYFGLTQADVDWLLKQAGDGSIPINWHLCVKIFPDTKSSLSRKIKFFMAEVCTVAADGKSYRRRIMTVKYTLGGIDPTKPKVRMLTELEFKDSKDITQSNAQSVYQPNSTGWHGFPHPPFVSAYIDGNNMYVQDNGPMAVGNATSQPVSYIFGTNIDLTTMLMTDFQTTEGRTAWISAAVYIAVPTQGPSVILDYLGGAGTVMRALQGNVNRRFLVSSIYPETGWVVYFRQGISYMIHGTNYSMPTGAIDLRDVDPNPQNKVFYIYTTIQNSEPVYIVSAVKLRHSLDLVPVVKLTTNDTQILTIVRYMTFIIGDYLVTTDRQPGSIPLSTGVPMEEGAFVFTRQVDYPTN